MKKQNINFMRKIVWALSLVSTVVITACTEDITITLDETYTRLAVEGNISTDTTHHYVTLKKSSDYFYNKLPEPVNNATVYIDDDDGNEFLLTRVDSVPGLYQTAANVYGVPGRTYTLHIDSVDLNNDGNKQSFTASSYLKAATDIDSIKVQYKDKEWDVKLYANEPSGKDYYVFKVYKNDTLVSDTISEWAVTDDALFDGQYTWGVSIYALSSEKTSEIVRKGDQITLEMLEVTEDYYLHIIDVFYNISPTIPIFSPPQANVRTNLSEGAVGYFAAYDVKRKSVIYTGDSGGTE
jgi:hypothetical protein